MTEPPIVVGLGELLWDCFPDSRRAGGAPANFAFHARQLGLGGVVCSRVGTDELGDELVKYLQAHQLDARHVQRDADHGTGRVDIAFSEDGEPNYDFLQDSAWDNLEFDHGAEKLAAEAAAVCFGTLAQRGETSRQMIHQFLNATPENCLRVFDVNLRPPWYSEDVIRQSLTAANIVKLNEDEVVHLAETFSLPNAAAAQLAEHLRDEFAVASMFVTCGARGCQLFHEGETAQQAGLSIDDPQPVGAGDSFTAAAIYGRLNGCDLPTTAALANRVAALVAAHQGAMPDVREEIQQILDDIW